MSEARLAEMLGKVKAHVQLGASISGVTRREALIMLDEIADALARPAPSQPVAEPLVGEDPAAPRREANPAVASEPPTVRAGSDEPAHRDPDERVKKGFRIGIEAAARAVEDVHLSAEWGERTKYQSALASHIRSLAAPPSPAGGE